MLAGFTLLILMVLSPSYYYHDFSPPEGKQVILLDVSRHCDYTNNITLLKWLNWNNTGYEMFTKKTGFHAVCYSTFEFKDYDYIVEQFRSTDKKSLYVFVFDLSRQEEYEDFVAERQGEEFRKSVAGFAEIPSGFALASWNADVVKHESAHLIICGTFHDADGNYIPEVEYYPQKERFNHCQTPALSG